MNIYVRNLSDDTTNADLQGLFEKHGKVASARVITDESSERSKVFGFVEMPDRKEAEKAIEDTNGVELHGRLVDVSTNRPYFFKSVSEAERSAAETAIIEKLGADAPKPAEGSAGNSPYAPETVVYMATGADVRGARIALAPVCRSHNGAGHYKGRGRWRSVMIAAPKADGDYAVCLASDRDADEIGASGFYVRPWETHEAETASRGLGLAQDAMASAFASLGL